MAKAPATKSKAAPRRVVPKPGPEDTVSALARRLTAANDAYEELHSAAAEVFSLVVRMNRATALRLPFPLYVETMDALVAVLRKKR